MEFLKPFLKGVVLILCCLLLTGCGYPEVSQKTYEFATALYGACNRKSEETLEKVDAMIHDAHEANELSQSEFDMLHKIVEKARSGDWEQAMLNSRSLMEAQAGR